MKQTDMQSSKPTKQIEGPSKPSLVFAQWKYVNIEVVHMCVVHITYLWDHCRTETVVKTSYMKSTDMSHDRFVVTLTRFPVENNENRAPRGQPRYDPH
jgi:hypothetical protein